MRLRMFIVNSFKRNVAIQALEAMFQYGNCELFQEGLKEVGLLGGKEWWWDCELFQEGLKAMGLVN